MQKENSTDPEIEVLKNRLEYREEQIREKDDVLRISGIKFSSGVEVEVPFLVSQLREKDIPLLEFDKRELFL
ncbi:hypothetical protein JTE90_015475 [Oedothorax gibbosus]|uniref:Uncharacterized protein n=1 Tax=Oedothorax gibbosus TaxID=931172 RepID=A0AAV6UMG0_9ARAC|nr:hypothetical protein JTE90_015475 [Oedothorax gibbosus]